MLPLQLQPQRLQRMQLQPLQQLLLLLPPPPLLLLLLPQCRR